MGFHSPSVKTAAGNNGDILRCFPCRVGTYAPDLLPQSAGRTIRSRHLQRCIARCCHRHAGSRGHSRRRRADGKRSSFLRKHDGDTCCFHRGSDCHGTLSRRDKLHKEQSCHPNPRHNGGLPDLFRRHVAQFLRHRGERSQLCQLGNG